MNLAKYLSEKEPKLPVSVVCNGRGLSNVPISAYGTVLSYDKDHNIYKVKWESKGKDKGIEESFCIPCAVSADLDVITVGHYFDEYEKDLV